jgi:hypothetical protein
MTPTLSPINDIENCNGTQRDSQRDYPSPTANRIGTGLSYVIGSPVPDADADEALIQNASPSPDATANSDAFVAYSESCWREVYQHDADYLASPRQYPTPCPWCKGRLVHSTLCDELQRSWEPALPWGKHKGKALSDVPADYLRWLAASKIDIQQYRMIGHADTPGRVESVCEVLTTDAMLTTHVLVVEGSRCVSAGRSRWRRLLKTWDHAGI